MKNCIHTYRRVWPSLPLPIVLGALLLWSCWGSTPKPEAPAEAVEESPTEESLTELPPTEESLELPPTEASPPEASPPEASPPEAAPTDAPPIEAPPAAARPKEAARHRAPARRRAASRPRTAARPEASPEPPASPRRAPLPDEASAEPTEEEVVSFPWPPPRASATEVIPRDLLLSRAGNTRLRDVDGRLSAALAAKGYHERRYFAVPAGFALVTRMEQIERDGTSRPDPNRFSRQTTLGPFSLAGYLSALLRGTRGFYRVIVFLVTPDAFSQSSKQIAIEDTDAWFGSGLDRLPVSIGNRDFSPEGYACTALVYEFEKPTEDGQARLVLPGMIPGRTHLTKSGIWGGFR